MTRKVVCGYVPSDFFVSSSLFRFCISLTEVYYNFSGRVLMQIGKAQFELQEIVDTYVSCYCHFFQFIGQIPYHLTKMYLLSISFLTCNSVQCFNWISELKLRMTWYLNRKFWGASTLPIWCPPVCPHYNLFAIIEVLI